ncbi:hypothetical protein ACHAXA_006755 [Cyclostephanos tholiformis]|uniref:Spc7 kinetochore protein domain-containing protein n=1 Tax=Cyclostephanos tholiformis TaxID=382380 RepID=A0ABD3SS55_9STRA
MSSSSRRNTYSAGEGVENSRDAANSPPPSSSMSAVKGVRWGGAERSDDGGRRAAAEATSSSALAPGSARTPSSKSQRRMKERFADVASGREDVVMNYHFDGTPFSQRKKKKKRTSGKGASSTNTTRAKADGGEKERPSSSSSTETEVEASSFEAAEDTFNLGRDATAEILRISAIAASGAETTNNNMNDTSILSLGSKSSVASSTTVASEDDVVDVLNCTTMSDTHELSTSNFIHNAKMRNLLAERSRALYGAAAAAKTAANNDTFDKKKEQQQPSGTEENIDATLTLPDLTLNLLGEITLSDVAHPPTKIDKLGPQLPSSSSSPSRPRGHLKRPTDDIESDDADGTYLEFTLSHRRTPRKGGRGDETIITNLTRLIEESSKMMAEDHTLQEKEEEEEKEEEQVGRESSNVESVTLNDVPDTDSTCDGTGGLRVVNSSYVESTASLNDLNNVLDEDEEKANVAAMGHLQTSQLTPLASLPSTNNRGNQSTSGSGGLCPSPSFLSEQKRWGSGGVAMLRKSLGGDLTEIHKLTASLRKEKKKNLSLMSLPSFSMPKDQQHSHQRRAGSSSKVIVDDAYGKIVQSLTPPRKSLSRSQLQDKSSPPPRDEVGTSTPEKTEVGSIPLPDTSDSLAKCTQKSANRKSSSKTPPTAAVIDSPAKNTRGAAAARQSPSRKGSMAAIASVDSPARNTRGATKIKSPSLPHASPSIQATRTATATKPPSFLSPTVVDSPARNTRGANNRKDLSPKHSSAAGSSSPARSLFNSPSDVDIFQEIGSKLKYIEIQEPTSERSGGPFSGRKRRSIETHAGSASAKDQSEPHMKRMSTSSEQSEPSMTLMLEMEYPFLSLSPNKRDYPAPPNESDESPSTASMHGIQTLVFDNLMQDIENDVSKSPDKDVSFMECDEDEDQKTFNTKHSRNQRRWTANTVDLVRILSDAVQDGTSPNASAAIEKGNLYPHTPSTASGMAPKTPKSILSSAKMRGTRLRKNVEFGLPEVAEFNINSPSVSMTQMHSESTRERWAIPENLSDEGERTTDLEGDLERLIARGNDTSVMMDTIDELGGSKDMSADSGVGMPFVGGEVTEDLETNILHLVDKSAEDSDFSLPSISSVSSASSRRAAHSSSEISPLDIQDRSMTEPTQTVPLEGTINSLVGGCRNNYSREGTQTMELEGTLTSLIGGRENTSNALAGEETRTIHLEGTLASLSDIRQRRETDLEITLPSIASTSTPLVRNDGINPTSHEYQNMNVEGQGDNQDSLLLKRNDNSESGEDYTISETKILFTRNDGGNRHVPREDDTISELGMNTASHTLRHEKELFIGSVQNIVDNPPELVNLELDEVVVKEDIDWIRTVEPHGDVFLKALGAAPTSFFLVKDEAEKMFADVCDEIERQLEDRDDELHFKEIIENNQDLMRSLQQQLRAQAVGDGVHDVKGQARLLLQAHNKNQFHEFNQWLTDAAEVYNTQLLNNVIPAQDKVKANISEKTRSIDQSREMIALPLLIRSAKRVTKMNFERAKREISSCENEVSELEDLVKDAEYQLNSLQSMQQFIQKVAKMNDKLEALRMDEKILRETADSSYYKFFSVERLHNWIVTGSNDSSISLLFRGPSAETALQLSLSITASTAVSMSAKVGGLPRSAHNIVSVACGKWRRFHPAVSGFLKSKMDLLCNDMNASGISKASNFSSMVNLAELRVARIEGVANELDAILGRCKSSFLQPSESVMDGYELTAHLSTASGKTDRLHAILTIPDCYPFAPVGLQLYSSSNSFDTESLSRKLKRSMKPGFGALTRAIDAVQGMLE